MRRLATEALLLLALIPGLALFSSCIQDSESISEPTQTGATLIFLQRPPVEFTEAISLIEEGRIAFVDISPIPSGAQFQLQVDPPQQWAGRGFGVQIFEKGDPRPLAVRISGQSTIGLDDYAVGQLLRAVNTRNLATPCSIEIVDHRSVEQSPSSGPSPISDCP